MTRNKTFSRVAGCLVAGWMLCMYPAAAVVAADDYLSALEAEAGDTATTAGPRQVSKGKRVQAGKVLEDGLGFTAFEETLGTHYSGTHFLYVKLSKADRQGVYRFYQAENRVARLREEVVRRLSSGE